MGKPLLLSLVILSSMLGFLQAHNRCPIHAESLHGRAGCSHQGCGRERGCSCGANISLKCFECDQVNAIGFCESGESFCQTEGSQQCYVRKVYEDDIISYGSQGCSSICIDMLLFSRNVAVDLKCCDDSSLCNKF